MSMMEHDGLSVKRGNSLGEAPLEGARRNRRTGVMDCEAWK